MRGPFRASQGLRLSRFKVSVPLAKTLVARPQTLKSLVFIWAERMPKLARIYPTV